VSGAAGAVTAVVSTGFGWVLSTEVDESELHPASKPRSAGTMSSRGRVMGDTVHDQQVMY
ncbi:MAG: hypothetical protein ACK5CE_11015, partial [Actinomycetes bacterium]